MSSFTLGHFGIGGPNRIYLTELIERKPCIFFFNASSVFGWSKTILSVRTQKRFLYRVAHTPVLSVRAEVPFGTDPTVPSESSLPSPEKRGSAFGDRCEPSFLFCQARRWCFTSPQAPCKNRLSSDRDRWGRQDWAPLRSCRRFFPFDYRRSAERRVVH